MIAGVAGGLGRYMGVDPVVIRVILIVLVFFGGAGFVGYGAAWLLIPRDDAADERFDRGAIARRTGIVLGVIVLTVVAAAGGAWGVAIGGETATAVIVILVGLALVAGAFLRGVRWLIVPAIVLALSAGTVAAADIDARGGTGERIYHPVREADVRGTYRLGVGHLWVDLRDVDLAPGEHRINLRLGVGQAEVIVPSDLCVSTRADISVGATQVFEREHGGIDHDWQEDRPAPAGRPHLTIDGDIGVGHLRVATTDHGRLSTPAECGLG